MRKLRPIGFGLLAVLFFARSGAAQDGDEDYGTDVEQEDGDVLRGSDANEPPAPKAAEDRKQQEADASFETIMNGNAPAAVALPGYYDATTVAEIPVARAAVGAKVVIPLELYTQTKSRLAKALEEAARSSGPLVVLGEAEYRGEARQGALALDVKLKVTLDRSPRYKQVPLIGDDVVLVSAKENGQPLPVSRQNGYNVWVTRESGEREIVLEVLVPARGPRGSIEYDFRIARTPVANFHCRFPLAGLEPRLDQAVRTELIGQKDSTILDSTIRPSTRIHLVGFRDFGETAQSSKTKVYAETLNLFSVDESTLEMFTVVRYTILYGAAKDFQILIPSDVTVESAEGDGAYRYVLEKSDQGTLIRGETAFPIQKSFEVSLRLHRELARTSGESTSIDVPLPKCLGVEREVGWLGVEVPGKLKLEEEAKEEILAVDARQLPPEMVENAVTPILKAYRYHSAKAKVRLRAERMPEKDPASASVDEIRAVSVVSAEGKLLTDVRITMRNRLRHSLILDVPAGSEVLSTFLDDQPVKPSKDESGRLMLPLIRSTGGDRLQPFTLQVVLESSVGGLGWIGYPELSLPAVDLPVSSLSWTVFLPARNTYSSIHGDIAPQLYAGSASWYQPTYYTGPLRQGTRTLANADPAAEPTTGGTAASADTGSMPVRIHLPETGVRLEMSRYWIEPSKTVRISVGYLRSFLEGPISLVLVILLAVGVALFGNALGAPSVSRSRAGAALALAALVPLHELAGSGTVILGLLVGLGAIGHRRGWWATASQVLGEWRSTFKERYQSREKGEPRKFWGKAGRVVLGGAMMLFALLVVGSVFDLVALLSRPLSG